MSRAKPASSSMGSAERVAKDNSLKWCDRHAASTASVPTPFLEVELLEHGREAAVDKLIDPSLEVFLVPTGWVGAWRREV
jgi:hypothetical protein